MHCTPESVGNVNKKICLLRDRTQKGSVSSSRSADLFSKPDDYQKDPKTNQILLACQAMVAFCR